MGGDGNGRIAKATAKPLPISKRQVWEPTRNGYCGLFPVQRWKTAVIGSGRIGRAWAIVFARNGATVTIHDASQEMLKGALPSIRQSVGDLESFGLIEEPVDAILERVTACGTLEETVRDAALVQKNIAEVVEVKRALFAELYRLTQPDALLASSTSGLPASKFTESLQGRARCFVGHPVNPLGCGRFLGLIQLAIPRWRR